WIFLGSFTYLHKARPTFSSTALQFGIITHCRRYNITADLTCGIQYRCSRWNLHRNTIDAYLKFYVFRHLCLLSSNLPPPAPTDQHNVPTHSFWPVPPVHW